MKTTLLLLLVILFSNLSIAQTTAIPDPNFEQALINLGLDSGPIDGVVLTANIDTVTELDVSWQNINNLTGIQDFSSLVVLDCRFNQLTSLDITQNISLVFLVCDNNLLNSLDVTYNTSLVELDCHYNQLTSLDVSQNISLVFLSCYGNLLNFLDVTYNISLKYFICSSNQLVELDLSQNTSLIGLTCSNNQLSCLNMKNGNNINITSLNITYNSNLTCVEVDNASYSTNNWNMNINYSYWMYFSENCNNLCSTVGIEENSLSSLSLYPNPTTGNVFIDLGELKKDIKATLTNSIGQVVLTQNYVSTKSINFDIDLPKGLYFLTLETDGEVFSKKIIKQ